MAAETTGGAETAAAGAISILFAALGSRVPTGAPDAAPVAARARGGGAGAGIDRPLDVDIVLDPQHNRAIADQLQGAARCHREVVEQQDHDVRPARLALNHFGHDRGGAPGPAGAGRGRIEGGDAAVDERARRTRKVDCRIALVDVAELAWAQVGDLFSPLFTQASWVVGPVARVVLEHGHARIPGGRGVVHRQPNGGRCVDVELVDHVIGGVIGHATLQGRVAVDARDRRSAGVARGDFQVIGQAAELRQGPEVLDAVVVVGGGGGLVQLRPPGVAQVGSTDDPVSVDDAQAIAGRRRSVVVFHRGGGRLGQRGVIPQGHNVIKVTSGGTDIDGPRVTESEAEEGIRTRSFGTAHRPALGDRLVEARADEVTGHPGRHAAEGLWRIEVRVGERLGRTETLVHVPHGVQVGHGWADVASGARPRTTAAVE